MKYPHYGDRQHPMRSLPPWERGLKLTSVAGIPEVEGVAPPVGAWIEIYRKHLSSACLSGRSPRGSVD